ncbi:hypothetical protein P7K49_034511 [Saguinus oedipus]|uniref:Phosducin thioredoxin-like domain-containing protein n=1 Tax=Saguinus oedipus TaxID=9490 RepID=A0ABQ9TUZ9_SAGOE|nr:hypothetical protein P7K49_034511 [Saguinus oedipus]
MQEPNADTEWNDILCKKGILPPKESLKELEEEAEEEQHIVQQSVVTTYEDMTLEELKDYEDKFNEEDEHAIEMNLPTIFVYLEGDIKAQFVGPLVFGGMNLTRDELKWKLPESGAIRTDLEENPKKQIEDVLLSSVKRSVPTWRDSDSDGD